MVSIRGRDYAQTRQVRTHELNQRLALRRTLTTVNLVGSVSQENRARSLQKDCDIKPNGPLSGILNVQTYHVIEGDAAAPLHLPQARDSRLNFKDATAMPCVVALILVGQGRARSDQRHLT